jgi:hypothetical protein
MTRKPGLLLACALVPIALLTGCGSSHSKTGAGAQLSAAKHNAAQAFADCQKAAANPGDTPPERTILQSECTDIRTGNVTALKAAGQQLCVQEAALMPKARRAAMLAGCKQKVP